MEYLLDTNMCIYIIKNRPPEVREKFDTLSYGQVGLSSITLSELHYGVEKSELKEKNRVALRGFTLPLVVAVYGEAAAVHYGNIRAYLERTGQVIGALDMLIAAHARSMDITLVTNNTKEFKRVPDLKIENWITSV